MGRVVFRMPPPPHNTERKTREVQMKGGASDNMFEKHGRHQHKGRRNRMYALVLQHCRH